MPPPPLVVGQTRGSIAVRQHLRVVLPVLDYPGSDTADRWRQRGNRAARGYRAGAGRSISIAIRHVVLPATTIRGIAYVVVASVTVLVPLGIYVLMRSKADELLANLGEWMKSNSDAITIVVLVIFGVKLLLSGLAGLT